MAPLAARRAVALILHPSARSSALGRSGAHMADVRACRRVQPGKSLLCRAFEPVLIMNHPDIDAIVSLVEQALKDGDVPRAFEVVAPWISDAQLESDARLAGLWLTLLRCQPGRASLVADAE